MNKKLIISFLIGFAVVAGIIILSLKSEKSEKQTQNRPEGMIFFYSETCPHCKNVEKFLEENKNVTDKVEFSKLEVSENKDNGAFLVEVSTKCGISTKDIGVPLFWDGEKCTVGDVDIINLLKKKAGIE